jgi:putative transposase
VLRYIERNPLRAGLVVRAQDWPWSSLPVWLQPPLLPWLDPGPVPRPGNWLEHVQAAQTEVELAVLRRCAERGRPYGSSVWVERTAEQLGIESGLREAGRPSRQVLPAEEDGLFAQKES